MMISVPSEKRKSRHVVMEILHNICLLNICYQTSLHLNVQSIIYDALTFSYDLTLILGIHPLNVPIQQPS